MKNTTTNNSDIARKSIKRNLIKQGTQMELSYNNPYEMIPVLINEKSFEVEFVKSNGKVRFMECEFESLRYIDQGIMTVLDTAKNAFRSINFKTITKIVIGNHVFEVKPKMKKIIYVGNRKLKQYALIESYLDTDVTILHSWDYKELVELYLELIWVVEADLNAIRALFENGCNIDFYTIKSVIDGDLEFFEDCTLSEVAKNELFTKNIPTPDNFDTSYTDYKFQESDLEPYYATTSYGVIQYNSI